MKALRPEGIVTRRPIIFSIASIVQKYAGLARTGHTQLRGISDYGAQNGCARRCTLDYTNVCSSVLYTVPSIPRTRLSSEWFFLFYRLGEKNVFLWVT